MYTYDYVYILLIHVVVQQKLTKHCKTIMFQFFLNMVETEKKKSAHECYLMPLLDLSIR